MWPWELTKEFWYWVRETKTYILQDKKVAFSWLFFWMLSSNTAVTMLVINQNDENPREELIAYQLVGAWAFDIIICFIQLFYLSRYSQNKNIFRFIHMIIHLYVIAVVIQVFIYLVSYKFDDEGKPIKRNGFIYAIILLGFRFGFTSAVTIIVIILSPCILKTILKERRLRNNRFANVRGSISDDSLIRYNSDDEQVPPHRQDFNNIIVNEDGQNVDVRDRQDDQNEILSIDEDSIHDILNDDFFNYIFNLHNRRPQINLDNLRRVTYQNIKDDLDFGDCSIWLTAFGATDDELLVYLPWSRNHIFHEPWIIPWLERRPDCPLCKAPVTQEAIEQYE